MSELRRGQRDYSSAKDRTHQSFKDECDINKIMSRILKTGIDPFQDRAAVANFLDCTKVPDFMEAQNQIKLMYDYFDSLPSSVRGRFQNDPAQLAEFLSDLDANKDEAEALGLIKPPAPAEQPDGGEKPPV
jgi:phage internal scaffolding protein